VLFEVELICDFSSSDGMRGPFVVVFEEMSGGILALGSVCSNTLGKG
jgi:hypothetical protein